MSKYSISDLEKLTGIKAHTLRMWEKRYDIVHPQRGPNNVRCYCEKDLEKLLRIRELNKSGYKISRLAALTNKDLEILYYNKCNFKCDCQGLIDALTLTIEGFEENRLYSILHERFQHLGMRSFVRDVMKPLQERIGLLVVSGHFSKLHLDFADEVLESLINAENTKCNLSKTQCVASVLIIHLGPVKPRIPSLILKHMLLKRNVEVSMFNFQPAELNSLIEIFSRKKFHEVYYCCNNRDSSDALNFEQLDPSLYMHSDHLICGPGRTRVYNLPDTYRFQSKDPLELYDHIEQKYSLKETSINYQTANN